MSETFLDGILTGGVPTQDVVIALAAMVLLIVVAAVVCFKAIKRTAQKAAAFVTLFYLIVVGTFCYLGVALYGEAWLAWIVPIAVVGAVLVPILLYSLVFRIGMRREEAALASAEEARQKEDEKTALYRGSASPEEDRLEGAEALPPKAAPLDEEPFAKREQAKAAKRRRGSSGVVGAHARPMPGEAEARAQAGADTVQPPIMDEAPLREGKAGHSTGLHEPLVPEGLEGTAEAVPAAPRRRRAFVYNASELRHSKNPPANSPSGMKEQEKPAAVAPLGVGISPQAEAPGKGEAPQKAKAPVKAEASQKAAVLQEPGAHEKAAAPEKTEAVEAKGALQKAEEAHKPAAAHKAEAPEKAAVPEKPTAPEKAAVPEKPAAVSEKPAVPERPVASREAAAPLQEAALQQAGAGAVPPSRPDKGKDALWAPQPQIPLGPAAYGAGALEPQSPGIPLSDEEAALQSRYNPLNPAAYEYIYLSEPPLQSPAPDPYAVPQAAGSREASATAAAVPATAGGTGGIGAPSFEEAGLAQAQGNGLMPGGGPGGRELFEPTALAADAQGAAPYTMPMAPVETRSGTYAEIPLASPRRAAEEAQPSPMRNMGATMRETTNPPSGQNTTKARGSQDLSFVSVYKKAEQLKDKGQFVPAAVLFEKAASMSNMGSEKKKALFAELACYAISDKNDKAYAKALDLRENYQLDADEDIKLNAIIQLLEA